MELKKALTRYERHLRGQERAEATIQKYVHDIGRFIEACRQKDSNTLTRGRVICWRRGMEEKRAPSTVNAAVAAVNGFLTWLGRPDCRVKLLRVQQPVYRERRQELTRGEYFRLLRVAAARSEHTACMLEAICATGIRVSELRFITVEALQRSMATIRNKGKYRTIVLPTRLRTRLLAYCRQYGIVSGPVFVDKKGKALSRFTIWRRMKQVCQRMRIAPEKVFPHNLRHLFAVCFYRMQHDLEHLADILGHSSINTTRIYTRISGEEHLRQMDALRLTR